MGIAKCHRLEKGAGTLFPRCPKLLVQLHRPNATDTALNNSKKKKKNTTNKMEAAQEGVPCML